MTRRPSPARTLDVRPADANHQVVSVEATPSAACRKPCANCPWRLDAVGVFPAEAFRVSARTAYDLSRHVFACHQAGKDRPRPCAGFLLRGATHNMAVRLAALRGQDMSASDGGHALHADYRAMAIANGVDPEDPVLAPCR